MRIRRACNRLLAPGASPSSALRIVRSDSPSMLDTPVLFAMLITIGTTSQPSSLVSCLCVAMDKARFTAALLLSAKFKVYVGAPHRLFITHMQQLNDDLLAFIGAQT